VAVGDIVKVLNGQYLPADMVLFSSRSGVLVGTALEMNAKNNAIF
jgi:magnesium-transporting ATPase (P-type)